MNLRESNLHQHGKYANLKVNCYFHDNYLTCILDLQKKGRLNPSVVILQVVYL